MSKSKAAIAQERADQIEAIKTLRKMGVRPGTKVYCSLNHCSSSGMTRHISLHIPTIDSRTDTDGNRRRALGITTITGLVGRILGYRRAQDGGLIVSGCGMDMGFHVVYCLGRAMFPKGGPLDKSPREAQERRAGQTIETDGGYLLRSDWL